MVANNKQTREKCEADLTEFIKVNYREHVRYFNNTITWQAQHNTYTMLSLIYTLLHSTVTMQLQLSWFNIQIH